MGDASTLLAESLHGTLATLTADGTPYASLVACAARDGAPLFVLSELAEHTRNLRLEEKASFLVVAAGDGDPLAQARATFVGRCTVDDDDESRRAYLAAHPEAERYLAMGDFHVWRLRVEAVRTVAGFGVMGWERPPRAG